MIESYEFGKIRIDGREFDSDVIIYPDGKVDDSWWREEGHGLSLQDIGELVAQAPAVIIAGTGAQGVMRPDPALAEQLREKGIDFHAVPTERAVEKYNRESQRRKVGACLHLTC